MRDLNRIPGAVFHSRLILALSIMLLGCGQEPTTISGIVLLDGNPLVLQGDTRGSVVFQPANRQGPTLHGVIGPQGHYTLAAGSNILVPPGVYIATVSAVKLLPGADENQPPAGQRITPEKYASAVSSGLRVKLEPGANSVMLELLSDPVAEPASTQTELPLAERASIDSADAEATSASTPAATE